MDKTLKDFVVGCKSCLGKWIDGDKLWRRGVKWVKEEIKIWEENNTLSKKGKVTDVPHIKRLMKRLNITEEDLK
jgi:hypothetical protein